MSYYQGANKKDNPCCKSPPRHSRRKGAQPSASRLIDEIMNKYFCQKAHQGSSCSMFSDRNGSVYSMDRRLQYWAQILEERKKIACRITKATGKRYSHVLYNQTEEYRNTQNVKRVIDYAQRLDPVNLLTRKIDALQDPFVRETLPKSERLQQANIEIVGIPKVSQAEQCLRLCSSNNSSFLASNVLQRTLQSNPLNISKVLEFYPDIDGLQVVGQRIHKHVQPTAERISDFELSKISSDSTPESWEGHEFPDYCIQINDILLRADEKFKRSLVFHIRFKCKPFERQMQTICKVKNLGKKPVQLTWAKIKALGAASIRPGFPVFKFNQRAFRIAYSESEDIIVYFMSSERIIREEAWCLNTEPNFFENNHKIYVKLSGECYIPEDYFRNIIWDILDSCISHVIRGQRPIPLSEIEKFEKINPGFKCEPGDLRRFNEIYRQIKRKSHPPNWDQNLQTLKELIESIPDYTQRSIYLDTFMKIIREMRRRISGCDSSIRILLVKNLIISALDKWETNSIQIRNTVANTNVDNLVIKMPLEHVIEQINQCKTQEEKRQIILHNALYVQMYCALSDLAEDMVSFMENCLLLYAY